VNAIDVLIAHHEELRSLIAAVNDAWADPDRRRTRIAEFAVEAEIHEQIEDEIFYPAVEKVTPMVGIAHAEHRLLADQLAATLRADDDSPALTEEWRALTAALEHHAGKEEAEMFPEVALMPADELEALGQRLGARKDQLRASAITRARLRVKHTILRNT
jgi:hemerythrin superfamily protein